MRAVGVIEFGGPAVLRVVELPSVHAGAGEVRIRVAAAAVNATDLTLRNGARADALSRTAPPYVPGIYAAGVIDEMGTDGVVPLCSARVKRERTSRWITASLLESS